MKRLLALMIAAIPATAIAADVTVTKTAAIVADGVNLANPKLLPGATVEYSLRVQNTSLGIIRNLVVTDTIDPRMKLKLDYGAAGTGPVEFADGGVLGLLGSALAYAYPSGVAYSKDGRNFTYTPVPVGGFDPNVRAIRVTLTPTNAGGSFAVTGSLRLRYRTEAL